MHDSAEQAATLETLSRRFRTPLRRFFEKRLGSREEIEDLIQEVFVRLVASSQHATIERSESYLFRTAANLLHDRQRRRAVRASQAHESYEEELHGSAGQACGLDSALQGLQLIQALVAGLYELPERTRTVFTLYHFEDLSHREIAAQLGIAISTIEKHIGRANAHLLKKMEWSS